MLAKPRRTNIQEINSSSMSDIAFLLLVFFLVTTTISLDKGIGLILPDEGSELEVNKKNLCEILINERGQVLIDNEPAKIDQVKLIAIRKMDKGKWIIENGVKESLLIFSLKTNKGTKYNDYLAVLDQLKQSGTKKISISNPPGTKE